MTVFDSLCYSPFQHWLPDSTLMPCYQTNKTLNIRHLFLRESTHSGQTQTRHGRSLCTRTHWITQRIWLCYGSKRKSLGTTGFSLFFLFQGFLGTRYFWPIAIYFKIPSHSSPQRPWLCRVKPRPGSRVSESFEKVTKQIYQGPLSLGCCSWRFLSTYIRASKKHSFVTPGRLICWNPLRLRCRWKNENRKETWIGEAAMSSCWIYIAVETVVLRGLKTRSTFKQHRTSSNSVWKLWRETWT